MKKIAKIFIYLVVVIFILLLIILCYFFVGKAKVQKNITWGVDFSQMQAEALKLNWKETYLAILNDLEVKNIKIHTQWDFVEGEKNSYYFDDIDWQLQKAKEKNVKVIYVVGLKTGRWPECHAPVWTENLSEQEQQTSVLTYINKVIQRYKNNDTIVYWQVENEPLLDFGKCPSWYYKNDEFLKKEVGLVKLLDPTRKIIVSDSGELNWWFDAAKIGDIVGTTMYRKAWVELKSFGFFVSTDFYGAYPFPPVFYWRKAGLIKAFFNKNIFCIELQSEPWASKSIYDADLQEQDKTMNLNQFRENVEYAKATGLDTFYFWGTEWWYWMKTKQNNPQIWNEAKKLFN